MEMEQISARAESFASVLTPGGEVRSHRWLLPVKAALDTLAALRRAGGEDEAARWLLDNWYLAETEGRGALAALRKTRHLRSCGESAVLLRCCEGYFSEGEGVLSLDGLEAWLTGFQRALPLTHEEHACLLPGLKAALVCSIAALYAGGSPEPEAVGRRFAALRALAGLDLAPTLERADTLDRLLRRDPAGIYPKMDRATRLRYRETLARQARRAGMPEPEWAKALLERSNQSPGDRRHIGIALLAGEKAPPSGAGYCFAVVLLPLLLSLALGVFTKSVPAGLLSLLPLSELLKQLADAVLLRLTKPRFVPRMELEHGVPKAGQTLCVISALLTAPEDAAAFAARLEDFRLCSRDAGEHLRFGLLADLPEGKSETDGKDAAILSAARNAVDALNTRYGGGFFLFTRPRRYDARDRLWRGWERKRGALLSLVGLLRGRSTDLTVSAGEAGALSGTRYLLTLDADTALTPGAARELIAAMLHPLNAPRIDMEKRVVVSGYGLLHPRVATDLKAATATDFARLFAGPGGTDPYGGESGELYMDRFACGGFAGKGILDIDALLACAGDLPEGRILSHDALEGALLRGGYLGGTEVTDGFPASPLSFWSRLERWTRGDWQNLPWLFRRGLRIMDRFRLLDSLRRSLLAPGLALAITAGVLFPRPELRLAAWLALASLLGGVLLALGRDLVRPRADIRARHYGLLIHGLALALGQAVLRLVFLPQEGFLCLSAAVRALWRSFVSRRRCLAWQTAAQSEAAKRGTIPGYYRAMLPGALAGLALLIFSSTAVGRAAGALWLLSPLVARALARPRPAAGRLSARDRGWLLERAGKIWRYFETYCVEEDHFLPPDNVQLQPPAGAAHRTSATNLGLGLLACLCADTLGVSEGGGLALAERMLASMEALPRWKGHFYNWYHTMTLRPLQPAYVSTVDSGNLAACLIAAAGAFRERGREDLAARCEALLAPMDFSPLYDAGRRLFRIGLDADTAAPSPGWYDFLCSEARLTGYLAIARGDADKRHWRALSRAQVQLDGYRGLASWTGTMFEYLMPELFLPLEEESLLWESARFCLYAQKKRPPRGLPWGVSESGYYALDPALHYRYKAHGVSALALCRGMDREFVVSPYSSFLALMAEPRAALRNLRHLERLGHLGPFGFWEAVDFTPGRCRSARGEAVRSVMAHHLGMSLAAVCNVLADGAVRRWTMADPAMRSHRSLLQERVPLGGPLLRRAKEPGAPKPRTEKRVDYVREGVGTDAASPAACLLSNGETHLTVRETGAISILWGDRSLFLRAPKLRLAGAETLFPLAGGDAARWRFTARQVEIHAEREGLRVRLTAAVAEDEPGVFLTFTFAAEEARTLSLELILEPALAEPRAAESHPAFWRLGLLEKRRPGAVLWRRLPRGDAPGAWLALAADPPPSPAEGERWLRDGRSCLRWDLSLPAGEAVTLRLALAAAPHQGPAERAAQLTLAMPESARAALPAALAVQLGLTASELVEAMALVGPLTAGRYALRAENPELRRRDALWRLGVSGDLPILAAELNTAADRVRAKALLRQQALLRLCGLRYDLIFLGDDGGDYQRPRAAFLREACAALDRADALQTPGGVWLTAERETVLANAAVISGEALPPRVTLPTAEEGADRRDLTLSPPEWRFLPDGGFAAHLDHTLPRRVWTNVLTNGRFSCTAADSGCGDLWYRNAREGRVTPWRNDPWAVSGPETLRTVGEEDFSLFADGESDTVWTACFGLSRWETRRAGRHVRVTAFVPPETDARVLLIETDAPLRLRWRLDLLLAGEPGDEGALNARLADGVFTAVNPRAAAPFSLAALCSAPFERGVTDRAAAARALAELPASSEGPGCFSAEFSVADRAVLVVGVSPLGRLRPLLNFDYASQLARDTSSRWSAFARTFQAQTPDEALSHYLSGWAASQTLACRLLARGSLYQSGGAIGFRDQLQDAVNLLLLRREPARRQILLCCAHQFSAGDVCHWWHPGAGQEHGVRTRISDDLLWLPWALAEYTEKTGDLALCAERTAFLSGSELSESERERYASLRPGAETGSVLEHAVRAVQCVLRRGVGDHGLLRMGTGDWNDGFDRVEGESVWLSFFFSHTAHRLAALLGRLGVSGAEAMEAAAARIGLAAQAAWDGAWYRRGYYADGAPLGSRESDACQIDLIAQSWAVLCPETDPALRDLALTSALERLYDRERSLVRLFDPPFLPGSRDPGYVRSYGPGFRENGGQYTHGAVWLAMALLRQGREAEGYEILSSLLPSRHPGDVYEAEPFVLAADVYGGDAPETAGWTWYTGAAGWLLRVAMEDLFGLRARDGQLFAEKASLPPPLSGSSLRWRDAAGAEHTLVFLPEGLHVDGEAYAGGAIGPV